MALLRCIIERWWSLPVVFATVILCNLSAVNGVFAEQSPPISGITEPVSDVTLSLSVPGIVSRIVLKEGDSVRKGQLILHLDKTAETLEVARRKLIWESTAEEEGAAARAQTLQELYEATLNLYEATKSISYEELKKIELEVTLAAAERDRIGAAELREKLEYELALDVLEKRNLRSPIDGVVITLFFEVGESSQEHQPLARVVDTSRGRFVCNLDESLGEMLKQGQQVDLFILSGEVWREKKGVVTFVSPVVDSASGLMEVKVEFDNKEGDMRPGMAGTMVFDLP